MPRSFLYVRLDLHPAPTLTDAESPKDGALADLRTQTTSVPGALSCHTYGTITCGYETMREAWPRMDHVFSYGGHPDPSPPVCHPGGRPPKRLLSDHPVDLLVVDLGHRTVGKPVYREFWLPLVEATPRDRRPKFVIESWPGASSGWEYHPMTKGWAQLWKEAGYASRYKLVPATWVGGAVDQERLLIARIATPAASRWRWGAVARPRDTRPMGNLLVPHGLLPYSVKRELYRAPPEYLPDSTRDPMPCCVGAWINTAQGTRRLQSEELGKGLGVSRRSAPLKDSVLRNTTSVFLWEYLSASLQETFPPEPDRPLLFSDWGSLLTTPFPMTPPGPKDLPPQTPTFGWKPPDLSPGSPWHSERIRRLNLAASRYPGRLEELTRRGIADLEIHRANYNQDGPNLTRLRLLWWEFPEEHWDELREGCDMGFVSLPERVIRPNSLMDEDERKVACTFVADLLKIGAFRQLRQGERLWSNAPIFCVPKPGQPGEYRVIADCKKGGQNAHIGGDPVYLNRPLHILEQMYTGGFSAVVDASKFFYQFPVRPEDQMFFGVVDPGNGEHLAHEGLPMGSGSSPGLAGRFGLAFIRMLKEQGRMFASNRTPNCWWTSLTETGYDPSQGYGFAVTRADGGAAVKIWVHVDDFLLHGPDWESTSEALTYFLDKAVDVGLLCNPQKLYPPSQIQRYCGFLFDTTGEPTLHIPEDKLDRCRAMAQHLGNMRPGTRVSRLALSVIAGTLESVADATPNRLGHTYLRSTHGLIHPEGHEPGRALYFTYAEVTSEVLREMEWWALILAHTGGRKIRSLRSGTLVPSWGDGSGTGTGGTVHLPGQEMQLWMGQWAPAVYGNTSNWKELKTLLLTLQQIGALDSNPVDGATLFYFTDNSPTYWIAQARSSASPGLHALIESIQLLTLRLGCHLEVVHVPGVVMIRQGTDGLSRGVWVSPYHNPANHLELNAAVFAPLVPDKALVDWVILRYGLPTEYRFHHYAQFHGKTLFDHQSVVFPPPECARQCLISLLEAWVERPFTTSSLIFVPRVVTGFWSGLSRHLVELGEFRPSELDLNFPPVIPIPFVVLHLAPHSRSAPSVDRRLVTHPRIAGEAMHRRHADHVRGLFQST